MINRIVSFSFSRFAVRMGRALRCGRNAVPAPARGSCCGQASKGPAWVPRWRGLSHSPCHTSAYSTQRGKSDYGSSLSQSLQQPLGKVKVALGHFPGGSQLVVLLCQETERPMWGEPGWDPGDVCGGRVQKWKVIKLEPLWLMQMI